MKSWFLPQHFKNKTSPQKLGVSKGPPAHRQDEHSVGCLCFSGKDLTTFVKLPSFPESFSYTPGRVPSTYLTGSCNAMPITEGVSHTAPSSEGDSGRRWLGLPGSTWAGEEIQTLHFLIVSGTSIDGKGHYLWGSGYNPLRDPDATVGASSTLPVLRMKSGGNLQLPVLVLLTIIQKC